MNFYPKSKLWNRAPWHSVRRRAAIWLSQGANCRHFRAANRFMKTARFSQPITTRAAPRHPQSAAEDKIPQNLWASFEYFFACCFYSRMPSGDARWRVSRACESNVQFSTSRMNKKKVSCFDSEKVSPSKNVFSFLWAHPNNTATMYLAVSIECAVGEIGVRSGWKWISGVPHNRWGRGIMV